MTYDSRERSIHDASPVELYEFSRLGSTWRYTSQASDYDLGGIIYDALPIRRTSSEVTQDVERVEITLTMPRDVEVVESFVSIPPASVMQLTVRRVHRGDGEAVVFWMGRVLNVTWRKSEVEIHCEPVLTSLKRNGLRRLYGRNCPHTLYDQACRAQAALHRLTGTVTNITGSVIEVGAAAGAPANSLDGGYAAWVTAGGANEQRTILSHSGADVELLAIPFGLAIGDEVQLHEGCAHTLADCDGRFANTLNYGGFPHIPLRNPFDSSGPTY